MTPKLAAMNCSHRFFDLEEFFSSAAANGYEAVELWLGPMHHFMDYRGYDPVERLLRLEEKHGVKVIGICPEQTNPKPHNMAVRDEAAKERSFAYFCNAVDLAAAVGANQVVVTSGWGYLNEPQEAARERSIAMLKRVAAYAGEKGVPLAIEALQPEESLLANSAAELKALVDDVAEPALKVCLDTGAMARAKDTIRGYFELFGADVIHVHFVDAGHGTTHLAWGDGERDMAADLADFSAMGYTGWLSSETVDSSRFIDPAAADAQTMRAYINACKEVMQ